MLEMHELVDRVASRTAGTRGDPLDRAEVHQVVEATVAELGKAHDRGELELDTPLPHPEADPTAVDPGEPRA